MRNLKIVVMLSLIVAFIAACGLLPNGFTVTATAPANFALTQDVNQIVQATFQAMTAQATPQMPVATSTAPLVTQSAPTAAPATGSISGNLMYPSSFIPALRIVAFRVGSSDYYFVDTASGQSTYQLDNLPPGTYHVVAYVYPGGTAGGYSQMVLCGLQYGCNDHTLVDVQVTAGNVTTGVNPNDYYADPGAFPSNPAP